MGQEKEKVMEMWEILVPTTFEDNKKPVRLKHHKKWDAFVRKLTGGLTILKPAKGEWVNEQDGKLSAERVIPVRIAGNREDIDKIIDYTIKHYRQIAVMAYKISTEVIIRYGK